MSVTKLVPDGRGPISRARGSAIERIRRVLRRAGNRAPISGACTTFSRLVARRDRSAERGAAAAHRRARSHVQHSRGARTASARPWQLDPLPLVIARDRWEALARGLRQRAQGARARCTRISTVRGGCCRRGSCPRSWCSAIPTSRAPVRAGSRAAATSSICTRVTWAVTRAASSRCIPIARRLPPGRATRSRIAWRSGGVLSRLFNDYGVQRMRRFFASVDECVHSLVHGGAGRRARGAAQPGSERRERVRARLPDSLPRLRARRGSRSDGARSRSLPEDAVGPEEGRTSSCAARTIAGAMPCTCARTRRRACPGWSRPRPRARWRCVNPLGVAAVEAPGLKPYLDAVSRFFFGDGLELPSVPSWWCGEPASLTLRARAHRTSSCSSRRCRSARGPLVKPAQLIARTNARSSSSGSRAIRGSSWPKPGPG